MFKLNPIPKEIIKSKNTQTIKNILGEDIILTTISKHSVRDEQLKIFNLNLKKIEQLIKNENQKNNIQNWLSNFYEKLNNIRYWFVYTSNNNDILFHIIKSYAVLDSDNSGGMVSEYYIFVFSVDDVYKEYITEKKLHSDYEIRDWWFNKIKKENIIQTKEQEFIYDELDFGDDDEKESFESILKRLKEDLSKGIFRKSYEGFEIDEYIKKQFLIYDSYTK
jgi:hypothetical protein